jgi:hypothetical protein
LFTHLTFSQRRDEEELEVLENAALEVRENAALQARDSISGISTVSALLVREKGVEKKGTPYHCGELYCTIPAAWANCAICCCCAEICIRASLGVKP